MIELPLGGRLVVTGNLAPGPKPSFAAIAAVNELVVLLGAWDGPGVFVVCDEQATVDEYPRLADALSAFGSDSHRQVVFLADGDTLDVAIVTGVGTRKVRVGRCATTRKDRALFGEGYAGVIDADPTARFEDLGSGFSASCGTVGELVQPRRRMLGLPQTSVPTRVASWVEVEAGADLHARLWYCSVDVPGASFVERIAARRATAPDRPTRVAVFPSGESWPPPEEAALDRRARVRRRAAALIALAGLLDIASAITPPLEQRLHALLRLVPLAVPQTATALVTLSGLALLALARGVRRGQLRAHRVALVLLLGSLLLHVVKGVDVEEAVTAGLVAAYLYVHRDDFGARSRERAIRHGVRVAAAGLVVTVASVAAALEIITSARGARLPLRDAFLATVERLVGVTNVKLPDRVDDFVSPMLIAVSVGFFFWIAWQAIRPVAVRRSNRDELVRARRIIDQYCTGTLDYFALREDKEFFFSGESLVAYAVHQSVCLVSPDPIGPVWERAAVWDDFLHFADEHGWSVGLLGVDEDWLPIYRAAGMHDMYVGDEAVVDASRFSLEGPRRKALRQATNRVLRYGYSVTFHDPSEVDEEYKQRVLAVMTKSRRGDVERGFSMTLGRIFNPEDKGLLLAVCADKEGTPVAFCQFVPAPGING
ncbi:MAG TPA: phosphatidylglycerol lysyltransferase domain-containing protein, partial [Acidimicrobiales bacterium]|nr:phosphatidylglycerol lysyltransferase domain-containing protein [Acidimicrobiales bacterium]